MSKPIGHPILHAGTSGAPLSVSHEGPPAPPAKLHAFTVPIKGGVPKVFVFDESPDGLHELANLIRGERVLAVVRGHKVNVEAASTVALEVQGQRILDRIPLSE